jgi:hypothetical protein
VTEPERREIALRDGTVVEAIIGYRSWRLAADDGTVWLKSLYNETLWPQHEPLKSECRCHDTCTCGIYAYTTARACPVYYRLSGGFLMGEAALWGDVHVHELGYRAEFAQPLSLAGANSLRARVAAYQYDVPMVLA